jgi:hypothetical protein
MSSALDAASFPPAATLPVMSSGLSSCMTTMTSAAAPTDAQPVTLMHAERDEPVCSGAG